MNKYRRYAKKKAQLASDERYWDLEKELYTRREQLNKEKEQFTKEIKKSKISTSKLLIFFLFANCSLIELFSCWATVKMLWIVAETGAMIDFTPLVALIGSIVGEAMSYAVYSAKSAKENSVNGITYELAMLDRLKQEEEVQG